MKIGIADLSSELLRYKKTEAWCGAFFSGLTDHMSLDYVSLLIVNSKQLVKMASWSHQDGFHFYSMDAVLEKQSEVCLPLYQKAIHEQSIVFDVFNKPHNAIWSNEQDAWYQVVAPIFRHNTCIGALHIESCTNQQSYWLSSEFSDFLRDIASDLYAHQLKYDIEKTRTRYSYIEQTLTSQNAILSEYKQLLSQLHEITVALTKTKDEDELYHCAITLGREYLGLDRMAVFLVDNENNTMYGTYGTDPSGNLVDRREFISPIPDHPLVNKALANKDYVAVKQNVPLYFGRDQVGVGWNAMISLWSDELCLGWIAADNLINKKPLTDYHRELLKLLGVALSSQIVIKRNHRHLYQLNTELELRVQERTQDLSQINLKLEEANKKLRLWSMQDGLTGINNRRSFDLKLNKWTNLAIKKQQMLGVIILDIDYFKKFNDYYGHLEGDDCIRKIAILLNKACESFKNSHFFRYGGEEFACLLENTSFDEIQKICDYLLRAVREENYPSQVSEFHQVTVSLGCYGLIPSEQSSIKSLLSKADRALYCAKESGRNRGCYFTNA